MVVFVAMSVHAILIFIFLHFYIEQAAKSNL